MDTGEWVEGYYVCSFQKHYIFQFNECGFISHIVDQNTLCQYTGLSDKNDKKIWENDICDRKEKYPEIVTYNEGDWQLDYSYVFGKEIHSDACNLGFYVCERNCVEVIGNIFDDSGLLEVE